MEQEKKLPSPKYNITLDGSRWSVGTYGIVEFLRGKWYLRGLLATTSIALTLLAATQIMGFKPYGLSVPFAYAVAITTVPWLLWIATISGNDFTLLFPSKKAEDEREQAERTFEQTAAPEDAIDLDMKRLNEYYVINQAQAKSSFKWAVFSMLLGFGTIVIGIWLFYFRNDKPDVFMSSLSTAAGMVVNIVSGLFLYLHNKTQNRALLYYQQLAQVRRVAIAMRLVEAHKDRQAQVEARNLVINYLLSNSTENALIELKDDIPRVNEE